MSTNPNYLQEATNQIVPCDKCGARYIVISTKQGILISAGLPAPESRLSKELL